MYIGLIPESPVFEGEHLTIVWMGHDPDSDDIILANILCRKMTRWLQEDRPAFYIAHREIWRNGASIGALRSMDARAMAPLYQWRRICEDLGLNKSEYHFQPHITEGSIHTGLEPQVRLERAPFYFDRAAYLR